jgi:hypothetical protein
MQQAEQKTTAHTLLEEMWRLQSELLTNIYTTWSDPGFNKYGSWRSR